MDKQDVYGRCENDELYDHNIHEKGPGLAIRWKIIK